MRPAASLAVLCLAACASGGSSGGAQTETIRISDASTTVQLTSVHTPGRTAHELPAGADALWKVLPAVYDSLGIPVTQRNPATRTLGNDALRVRRRLGNVPLGRYLDCGSTQGGPNTDTYEIFLNVQTQITAAPEAGRSRISTSVQAQARSINFGGDWVRCTSREMLEKRIAELAVALVEPGS